MVEKSDLADIAQEYQEFAYIVSHDLSAPLRHVRQFTQLLIEARGEDSLSADEAEYVQFLNGSLDRLDVMQRALLDFSRISTQGGDFDVIGTEDLVAGAIDSLQVDQMNPVPAIVYANLPDVYGDPVQISSVFSYVLENALKFQKPDRAAEILIAATEDDHKVIFEIKDNGIGIAEANLSDVFKLFRRLHAGDAYGGAGIGLTLAKKIVERHLGDIWVESDGDTGTRVFFTLPKAGVEA